MMLLSSVVESKSDDLIFPTKKIITTPTSDI